MVEYDVWDEVWCSQYSVYVRLIWTTVVLIYIKPTLNHFSAVLIGPKKTVEYCGFMCADHPKATIVAHRVQRDRAGHCRCDFTPSNGNSSCIPNFMRRTVASVRGTR